MERTVISNSLSDSYDLRLCEELPSYILNVALFILAYFNFYLLFVNDSDILLCTKKKMDVIVGDSSQNVNTQIDWTP
jgi:hypothetical protein